MQNDPVFTEEHCLQSSLKSTVSLRCATQEVKHPVSAAEQGVSPKGTALHTHAGSTQAALPYQRLGDGSSH